MIGLEFLHHRNRFLARVRRLYFSAEPSDSRKYVCVRRLLPSRLVPCCAACYMTSLRRWRLYWTIEIYEVRHTVFNASYHCWAFCSFGKNNNQNTFENNHFDSKRWPSSGIKRQTNWDLKQTFTHATLVCFEISVHFDRLKGHKNVGTPRYFFTKNHYYVYILWRDAQKWKTSTYWAKKSEYLWPCYGSINTLWCE